MDTGCGTNPLVTYSHSKTTECSRTCISTTNIICAHVTSFIVFLPDVHHVCVYVCLFVCLYVSLPRLPSSCPGSLDWISSRRMHIHYMFGGCMLLYTRHDRLPTDQKAPSRLISSPRGADHPARKPQDRPPTNAAWQFAFVMLHSSPRTCELVFSAQVTWQLPWKRVQINPTATWESFNPIISNKCIQLLWIISLLSRKCRW